VKPIGDNMLEQPVRQFTRSYYEGVEDIIFYERSGRREIQIKFINKSVLINAYIISGVAKDIFLVDEDNFTMTADRDKYETVIFNSVLKDAQDYNLMKMLEEKDREECEE
jgi:hypothetical protein